MSNAPIDRKTAEAARRNVIRIDAMRGATDLDRAIRAECVKVWNEFCQGEQRRLDAKPCAAAQVYETCRKLGWA
jgi:hypothetical protein